jgi:hypothetical protein
VRGELIDGGETRAQWRERENAKRERDKEPDSAKDRTSFLRNLPQGVPVPLGASALDLISQTLATMNPTQLVEVLAQFKVRHLLSYEHNFFFPQRITHLHRRITTGLCDYPPRASAISPCSASSTGIRSLSSSAS